MRIRTRNYMIADSFGQQLRILAQYFTGVYTCNHCINVHVLGDQNQPLFKYPSVRVRPKFFDQVGHETMYASSGNKHFFTKSDLPKLWTTSTNISKFVLSKSFFCVINWLNLSEKKIYEEYLTRRPTFIKFFFENFDF